MSVKSEIDRIAGAKSDIATAITNKGVTVPSGTKLDGMASLIDSISGGGGSEKDTVTININLSGTETSPQLYYYDSNLNSIVVKGTKKETIEAFRGIVSYSNYTYSSFSENFLAVPMNSVMVALNDGASITLSYGAGGGN